MMDLRTVKDNLADEQYESLEECLTDIQLIWDNCKIYNTEDSIIYKMAVSMEVQTLKLTQEIFGPIKKNPRTPLLIKSKDGESEGSGMFVKQNLTRNQTEIQTGRFRITTCQIGSIHGFVAGKSTDCFERN